MPYIDGQYVDEATYLASPTQGAGSGYAPGPDGSVLVDPIEYGVAFDPTLFSQQAGGTQQADGGDGVEAPSWLPPQLAQVWMQAWVETGDASLALDAVQRSDAYDVYFPGNRREDGSLRYSESEYLAMMEGFEDTILSLGVNPAVFRDDFVALIEGNVSVAEFNTRVQTIADRVLNQAPAIRDFFATHYAIDMTDAAIVAAALSPTLNTSLLNRQISVAEVGGQAALRGFGIDLDLATQIYEQGVTGAAAGQLFSQAATQLPILEILARRHNDPDDSFDINEFTSAAVFDDPEQRQRIRRLLSAERASFGASSQFAQDRARGAVLGLRAV